MPDVHRPHTDIVDANVATTVHGRYLLRLGAPALVLVGFHGYGEAADDQFKRLEVVAEDNPCVLLSIQGLHRFYERRTNRVVASWMTSQDRELAMSDNIAYVSGVVRTVLGPVRVESIVFVGFSQGVAMAFRAAGAGLGMRQHVVAVGGDIPRELDGSALRRLSSVLICRGSNDSYYSADGLAADTSRLEDAGIPFQAHTVPGGHEWSPAVIEAARRFLRETLAARPGQL